MPCPESCGPANIPRMSRPTRLPLACALLWFITLRLAAQTVEVSGAAVAVWNRTGRTPEGGAAGELRVIQSVLMGRVRLGPYLGIRATGNLEGLTMPDGELWLGGSGEGFVVGPELHGGAGEGFGRDASQPLGDQLGSVVPPAGCFPALDRRKDVAEPTGRCLAAPGGEPFL